MAAPIALQLYSLRQELQSDLEATITKIAAMGYIGVESYGGLDAAAVKKAADNAGLQIMGSHVSLPLGADKDTTLEQARIYEIDHIIIPSLPHDKFTSHEGIKELCDRINKAYANVKSAGLRLGYHNHGFEFTTVDGSSGYHIFLECLNPEIFLELDTYWAQNAGQDVVALLGQIGDRTPFLHIKDGPGGDHDAPQLALGEGIMDIPAVINSHESEWLIVELDSCATDMLEAVAKSYDYLISKGLARGNK